MFGLMRRTDCRCGSTVTSLKCHIRIKTSRLIIPRKAHYGYRDTHILSLLHQLPQVNSAASVSEAGCGCVQIITH